MAQLIDVGLNGRDKIYILKMGGVLVLLAAVGLAAALFCQYQRRSYEEYPTHRRFEYDCRNSRADNEKRRSYGKSYEHCNAELHLIYIAVKARDH